MFLMEERKLVLGRVSRYFIELRYHFGHIKYVNHNENNYYNLRNTILRSIVSISDSGTSNCNKVKGNVKSYILWSYCKPDVHFRERLN